MRAHVHSGLKGLILLGLFGTTLVWGTAAQAAARKPAHTAQHSQSSVAPQDAYSRALAALREGRVSEAHALLR